MNIVNNQQALRQQVVALRGQAQQLREMAKYADGKAYKQDLDKARQLIDEANVLERRAGILVQPIKKVARIIVTNDQRRALLVKKINTARRQLGWDDEAWETIKFVHGQCQSIAKAAQPPATMAQLEAILNHARACGFKDSYKKANGQRSQPLSQASQTKLLRGLWLEMHTLGAVRDPDENALCHWVMSTRKGGEKSGNVTTNLAFLEWCGDDLQAIERLKQWRLRWLKSGQMTCPECGRSFKPTDKQARAFGKIACEAHTPAVAYHFIPPEPKTVPPEKGGMGG